MQRRSNRHQLRLVTEMSITPLLNLVLIMLLVFMIAGPFMHGGHAMPQSGSQGKEAPPADIAKLTMDQDQTLSLEGRAMAPADLKNALAQLHKNRPNTGVLLQIHRDLPVHLLVDLMDALRQAGVPKTEVATIEK